MICPLGHWALYGTMFEVTEDGTVEYPAVYCAECEEFYYDEG